MATRRSQILSCGRPATPLQSPTGPHRHPGLELIWVEEGEAEVTAAGRVFRLGSGDILGMPAGCIHAQRNLRSVRQVYVVVDPGSGPVPAEPLIYPTTTGEPAARWLADLVTLHLAPGGSPAAEPALIDAILARLSQLSGNAEAQRLLPPPLAALVRTCEADPLAGHDETALARIAGVSPSHLRTLCRVHLGIPPQEVVRGMRLQLAQKLLRSSYLSIAEVASACGWDDANYFARLFRQRCGQAPRSFRRALLKHPPQPPRESAR